MSDRTGSQGHDLDATLAIDGPTLERPAARRRDEAATPEAPATIGRHLILGRLGEGGMGVVYAAYDPELDRKLAIKVIPVRPRRGAGEDAETARARVLREAQAMAKVSHPNVTAVFDVGTVRDQVYIAMELVEGEDLAAWLGREPRSWRAVVEVFLAAGEGLAAAHRAGLIHRDFKPENVLIDRRGRVRVADFGLARASAGQPLAVDDDARLAELEASGSALLRSDLTRGGALLGTPAYMSPEHFAGQPLDARSDLFSFCVALFEASYGERPFAGDTLATLCHAVLAGTIREPKRRRAAPAWLWRLITQGLAGDPEARPASLEELLARLRRGLGARRRRLQGVAALVVAGGLGGLWAASAAPPRCEGATGRLAERWDDARRAEVTRAFAAAELPYAEAAGQRAVDTLDAYAAAWTDMRRDACAATHVRGEQSAELLDLRMRCLDESLTILGARIDLLTRADARVIESAERLVGGLRPLRECADLAGLQAELPPPADPLVRAQVDDLRRRLAAIHARERAGHVDDGLALVDVAIADALALGHPPLIAEARRRRASLLRGASRPGDARVEGERAYAAAEGAGADALRAAIAVDMIYVAGRADAPDAAEVWALIADALLARRHDPELAAERLRNLAAMRFFAGEYEAAAADSEAAIAAFTALRGADDPDALRASSNLGGILAMHGELERARSVLADTLTRGERVFGPAHPQVANTLQNLASVESRLGRDDDALGHYRRELAIRQALVGDDHSNLSSVTCNLAGALSHAGRDDEVDAALDACEAVTRRHHATMSREVAYLEVIRCGHLLRRGDPAGALPRCREALTIRREVFGAEHPETLEIEALAGRVLAQTGACDEALTLLDHALAGELGGAQARSDAASARDRCGAATR